MDTTIAERPKAATNHGWPRNPGMELDLGLVESQRVNLSAGERRVASLPGRRTVKKDAQAAWLLKALTCIDLTTLNGDDTAGRVKRLCAKAANPIRQDLLDAIGMGDRKITTGAICVYHRFVGTAVAFQLRKMGVGPAEIGAFVGSFYLPWAFKWAFGPFVDVFRSKRLGHYRAWILGTQLVMVATLVVLVGVDLPAEH